MKRRAVLFLGALFLVLPGTTASAAAPAFREVGRVPLTAPPGVSPTAVERSGWLILDPTARRGYQVFEAPVPTAANPRTVVTSFDLDTLQLRRTAELEGVPIISGTGTASGVTNNSHSGEIVHAVDRANGRIYLALSRPQETAQLPGQLLGATGNPDAKRPLDRFVMIDEAAFDRGDVHFSTSFREPAEQVRLHSYWVMGMTITPAGKLVVLFAQPNLGSAPFYDHTLVQWDPSDGFAAEWERRLDACSKASLASAGANFQGNYQWGLLHTPSAIYTACQASDGVGAVVRIVLDDAGAPLPVGGQELFQLGRRISDVLVEEGDHRLFVRTFGGGHALSVFDAGIRSFTGVVAVKPRDAYSGALGIDPASQRLYALVPDHEVFQNGAVVPVQGGLQYSDPPGPLVNVHPELAYPAVFRIQVDPVAKRFFVRRGHPVEHMTATYPGTDATTPAPPEPFYRVYVDKAR